MYTAKQGYTVINDTLKNPIPFGSGTKNYEVALQYSYGYDIDVCVKYSLSWTNGKSTDNVILTFADRDSYVVDEQYVYYTKPISGTGTLKIFTGVEFVNTKDSAYYGESLTINILEVKTYKAELDSNKINSFYTTSHKLFVANSLASEGWLKAKNSSLINLDAHVMVYNYRYDINHGITYPEYKGAYKKEYVVNNSVKTVTNAVNTGGNRYYAGIGFYIITKDKPVSVTGYAYGSWQGEFQADNNIRFNYSEGWVNASDNKSSNVSSSYIGEGPNRVNKYTYKIPANSTAFIQMVDSIEITTVAAFDVANIPTTKVNVSLNDVSFENSKIVSAEISTSSTYTATNDYSKPNFTVFNSSLFNGDMFNISKSSTQTFNSHITITNNTEQIKNVSVSYKLRYYASNGSTSSDSSGDSLSSNYWYRYVGESSSLANTSVLNNTINGINPYSSVQLVLNYTVTDALYSVLSGEYDLWLEIVPTITETSSSNTLVGVETNVDENIVEFSIKNNSNKVVSISSVTGTIYNYTESYTNLATQPNDWLSNYWQYCYLSDGKYVNYTSATFDANNCYRDDSYFSSSNYSISGLSLELQPNEVKTFDTKTYVDIKNLSIALSAVVTAQTPQEIALINQAEQNLLDYSTMQNGSIADATGLSFSSANRVKTGFIYLTAGVYQVSSRNGVKPHYYAHKYSQENEASHIEYIRTRIITTGDLNQGIFIIDEDCYFKTVFVPSDSSGTTILDLTNMYQYQPTLIKLNNYLDYAEFENGSYAKATGADYTATNRVRIELLRLSAGTYYFGSTELKTNTLHRYESDDESTYIGYTSLNLVDNIGLKSTTFTLTEDCYVRFAIMPVDETAITDLSVENVANYIPFLIKLQDVNENDTALINYSASCYYVRFNGIYTGSNPNIITKNGWNYYIGVVQPNQILNIEGVGITNFEKIEVKNNMYSDTDMIWTDVLTEFNNYFK